MPANGNALPAGSGQGAQINEARNLETNGNAHGTFVVIGRGVHAYETAKAWLAQQCPELTPAGYLAACREAARLAGV